MDIREPIVKVSANKMKFFICKIIVHIFGKEQNISNATGTPSDGNDLS